MSYDILRIDPLQRASFKLRNLSVSVKKQEKRKNDAEAIPEKSYILKDISFDLNQNEMLAIMGGSGSGKTTLLNTLSQRLNVKNKNLCFEGTINYYKADELVDDHKHHIQNSYLLQDDFFPPGLTTWEHLRFQADLMLPSSIGHEEKNELIEKLLAILEIEHLRNKIICSFTHVINFSGGEKRRVSIAVQLMKRPSILFLDEPTTGLDTSSSLKLIQTLRKLSSSDLGVTVVLSIHQPRPEILVLFDKICLLTKGGRLVYYGNLVNSYNYFSRMNLMPQDNEETVQPSRMVEFIMKLSVKDYLSEENELRTKQQIDRLVNSWSQEQQQFLQPEPSVDFNINLKVFQTPRNTRISLATEIWVLTKRVTLTTYRDKTGTLAMIGLCIFMAVICGWMFYKPPSDLAGIRSITSCLYVMLEVLGFIPLMFEMERLWAFDGLLFFREYTENQVSIAGFLVSRRLGKLILEDFPITFGFGFITYFMFGLRMSDSLGGETDWTFFWNYLAVAILIYICGMASAMVCFAIGPLFAHTAFYQNIFYQLQNSGCGYFVNASTMPVYVRWIKYICYFWYGFGALTANQFADWEGDCPYDNEAECAEYTGNYQLDVLGFPKNWIAEPICILVAWFFGFMILAALGLRFRNYDVSMAKQKQNNIGTEEEQVKEHDSKEKSEELGTEHEFDNQFTENVGIVLDNILLLVLPPRINIYRKSDFKILNDISANFEANRVNVIMGPSGSGKTTLLNFVSERLDKSTRFKCEGKIKLNGSQEIKTSELKKLSGYVTQFDSSLIPHLTVRETFYYQALLRLPKKDHDRIPLIINTLIRQMGLVDCADTLIGNENLKGVSGGERRRVSIGIQLLGKPKVLFLDEPTSGLDSTTSVSILQLLDDLCKENGTTVVTTIHQPSDQIYEKFGSLLLLSRGGFVIYNGPSYNIESYLRDLNYIRPLDVNIADYMLDLVSQGIDEDKETAQLRINMLKQEWQIRGKLVEGSGEMVDLKKVKKTRLPFMTRFKTILNRQLLGSFRSKEALVTRSVQVIVLGVVHTLFFSPLSNGRDGIDNRLGLIQEVLNFYFIGFINNFAVYPIERDLFYQEFRDGIYSNFEFQLVYFIIESAVELITCVVFSVLIVFPTGLPRTPGMFFSMILTAFISINTGESLGIMVNCVFKHLGLAMNVLGAIMTVAIFMGGTMSLHMPDFFKGWNYINPLKYAVGICAELVFRGKEFSCAAGECSLGSGNQVLDYYELGNSIGKSFAGLVTCLIVFRIIACALCEIRIRYFL